MYDPIYFAAPKSTRFGPGNMDFVREVGVFIGKDKCCPECNRRLAFLKFVEQARELHQQSKTVSQEA